MTRLLCLLLALLLGALPASAAWHSVQQSAASGAADTYAGPCDSVACAEAYSVTRGMAKAYAGPLFQLVRTSDSATLDVGQAAHVADLSGVPTFCAGTTCNFKTLYAQINGTNLTPPNASGGVSPAGCNSATACAPPFFIDPTTGLPIVRTLFPTLLYNSAAATGITGGTAAASIYMYGRNEGFSQCCGLFGYAHAFTVANVDGTDFLPGYGFGTGHPYINCATATTVCAKVDIETFATDGADYLPNSAQQNTSYLATWGGSGANVMKVYVNSATPIYSAAPAATMNVPTRIRIGSGGDGSHVDGLFREGLISNAVLSPSDFTAINTNVSTFYGGRSANACASTADFAYSLAKTGGDRLTDYALSSTRVAYALKVLRASYYGPIADLRDAVGTVNTYGRNATGCGIDAAAATFCAAHAPCTVAKLYNQGTFSSQNVGNVHDTLLDLVQTTVAAQPQVSFIGKNGYPTMVFSGAQVLCSGTPSTTKTYFNSASFVAKRTGNFTGYNTVLSTDTNTSFGWINVASKSMAYISSFMESGTLSDSAWHSVVWEILGPGANQATTYGDNAVVVNATRAINSETLGNTVICIGNAATGGANFLTGEVAEAVVSADGEANTTAATVYNLQKAAWGL